MLSTSRLGLVVVVVPWQKISSTALLPSPSRLNLASLSVKSRPISRITASLKSAPPSSPASSSPSLKFVSLSCFWAPSSCSRPSATCRSPRVGLQQQQQQRLETRRNCRRRLVAKSISVDLISPLKNLHKQSVFDFGSQRDTLPKGICTSCRAAGSQYPPPALSSSYFCSSSCFSPVMLRRPKLGRQQQQQQQQRRVKSTRRRQMSSIVIKAVASTDDTRTNLNQKPLDDELQRYGVDESDYDYTATNAGKPQPNFAVDMEKHRTTSRMLRKRKATAEATAGAAAESSSGSKQVQEQQQQHTLNEESGVVEDWCAYLLLSGDSKKTYVGVTYNIKRRLRQHNGEITGGAKSARAGRPWRLVCTVRGFNTRSEACQFEWRWKSTAAKIKMISQLDLKLMESPLVTRRRATLAEVLKAKEEWSYLNVRWQSD